MLNKPMNTFDMDQVNSTIFESLVHTDTRRIQPRENWLQWIAGVFHEPLSRTQNPHRIASGGGGICSEATAVLNHIANLNGLDTRFVALNGHVLSEVRTRDGWRLADPGYGFVYPVGLTALKADAMVPMMRQLLEDKGYNDALTARYVEFFQSAEDNRVTEINVALSPRLHTFEVSSEWLKWLIPGALILSGAFGLRRPKSQELSRGFSND